MEEVKMIIVILARSKKPKNMLEKHKKTAHLNEFQKKNFFNFKNIIRYKWEGKNQFLLQLSRVYFEMFLLNG